MKFFKIKFFAQLSVKIAIVTSFFYTSLNAQIVYTPGSAALTYVVPACVTEITVQVWGAGGGGGGTIGIVNTAGNDGFSDSEVCVGAGGGAGGGYTSRTFPVTAGQVYNVVAGAGGTAGPAGSGTWNGGISTPAGPGGTGGTSSFTGNGINLQATGGSGGGPASGYHNTSAGTCVRVDGTAGLTGGTGSGGTVNFTGGTGAVGYILNHSTDKSGGAGGGAGPGGNGGNAPHPNTVGVAVPPAGIGNAPGGNGGTGRMTNVPGTLASNGANGSVRGGGGGGSLIHRTPYNVSVASGGIGGNGEVWVTETACPLPIELISFNGECYDDHLNFDWSTASEKNNDYFTIEQSTDGVNYKALKTIDGAGNSQTLKYYSTTIQVREISAYYRLRQTDFDGKVTFSEIVYIQCDNKEGHIRIYPNPANDKLEISYNSNKNYTIEVYDVIGRLVKSENVSLNGSNIYVMDINDLDQGNFVLKVISGDQEISERFTKVNNSN